MTPAAVGPLHHSSADIFDFDDHADIAPASDDPMLHVTEDDESIMLDENLEEVAEEVEPIEPLNHKAEVSIRWFRCVQVLAFNFSSPALS